jgi:hypothetical protein
MPKYPNIKVQLTGRDGNAFFVLGTMQRAFKKAKVSETEIKSFMDEAMNGDYDHLLATCMNWAEVS